VVRQHSRVVRHRRDAGVGRDVAAGHGSFPQPVEARRYFFRADSLRDMIGPGSSRKDRLGVVFLDPRQRFGESMMPTIQPGAMLLVDNGYDTGRLEPRTICFVNLAEKPGERLVAVKRVTVTDHVCVLESDNYPEPEFFPVIRHVGKNIRDLVLGVVLEWSTRARIEDPEKPADESNDPPA